jgi:anaerobic selenocysteine-containing dehydrogenase
MKGERRWRIVHSPCRVYYPMRRITPKGENSPGRKRISWEEALTETAPKLAAIREENGAEAIAFATTIGSGAPISDSID